jgi:hypothetical protein
MRTVHLEKVKNKMQPTPAQRILEDLNSMWKSYALQAAAKFNFATLIGDSSATTSALALQTGAQEGWVYRLLRFLAASGIFAETVPGSRTFTNTEASDCLRENGPMYAMARMMGSDRYRQEWRLLEESMRTGTSAIELLSGGGLYTYFVEHPEEEAIFDAALANFSRVVDAAIATTYDFSHIKRLVDVGGGRGSLLIAICQHYPDLQGVLFERPSVLAGIKAVGIQGSSNHSIELVAGDFFTHVPEGADAYLLKEVLHNWDDVHCIEILKLCSRAMRPGAVVLVCEQVVSPDNNQGVFSKGLDLLMGLEQQGGERTLEEFKSLYEAAGLRLVRSLQTRSPHWILEGVIA